MENQEEGKPSEKKTYEEQTCPNCGMTQSEWSGQGKGYQQGQEIYCCQGCAEGTECNCGGE